MGMAVVPRVIALTFHPDVKIWVSTAEAALEIRKEPEGVELMEDISQARWVEERLQHFGDRAALFRWEAPVSRGFLNWLAPLGVLGDRPVDIVEVLDEQSQISFKVFAVWE